MLTIDKLTVNINDKTLLDLSLDIKNITALVGSSGSGKTLTIKTLLDLLPNSMQKNLEITSNFDLIRGKSLGFVPQNPFTALSPMDKIKKQFHIELDLIKSYLDLVGLELDLIDRFPSELSGGQLQRVLIAMALSSDPKLLLLDEPTTALDPTSKNEIANLLLTIASKSDITMLLVTHDIGLVKMVADFVAVLDSGKVIEYGTKEQVVQDPQDARTIKLLESNFTMRNWRE